MAVPVHTDDCLTHTLAAANTPGAALEGDAASGELAGSHSLYWVQTRQPLACLIFLAPLIAFYELGVQWCGGGPDLLRNGADCWMRLGLERMGTMPPALLPVLVGGTLLGWQIVGRYSWRVTPSIFAGMMAESLLFACGLVLIGQCQDMAFQHCDIGPLLQHDAGVLTRDGGPLAVARHSPVTAWGLSVSFVGAGIYEEVLFRLCLFPLCFAALRILQVPGRQANVVALLATSLLFSAAHYIGPAADTLSLFSFTFRVLAGLFFAVLFVVRGFGVTAGCHAAYDVLVGVLLR